MLSTYKDDWMCGPEPYVYPLDKLDPDPWEKCHDVVDNKDKEFCEALTKEISWLLVVVSSENTLYLKG